MSAGIETRTEKNVEKDEKAETFILIRSPVSRAHSGSALMERLFPDGTASVSTRCASARLAAAVIAHAHPSLFGTASANRRRNCWRDLHFNSFQSSDADKADQRGWSQRGPRFDMLRTVMLGYDKQPRSRPRSYEHRQDLRRHGNLSGSTHGIYQHSQEAARQNIQLLPHWLQKICIKLHGYVDAPEEILLNPPLFPSDLQNCVSTLVVDAHNRMGR